MHFLYTNIGLHAVFISHIYVKYKDSLFIFQLYYLLDSILPSLKKNYRSILAYSFMQSYSKNMRVSFHVVSTRVTF